MKNYGRWTVTAVADAAHRCRRITGAREGMLQRSQPAGADRGDVARPGRAPARHRLGQPARQPRAEHPARQPPKCMRRRARPDRVSFA